MNSKTSYDRNDWNSFLLSMPRHPSFWPGIRHNNGEYGFNFTWWDGLGVPSIPWETIQLNVTEDFTFDYTHTKPEDPPQFLPYQFEVFDWRWWCTVATFTWILPFVIGGIYLAAIFGLEKYMRNRKPFGLKWPLFIWNASLGIFSIIGFARVAPEFFTILGTDGLYQSICFRDGGNFPMAYWSLMFVLSKYVELGDTIFIMLRKRPLLFIQWYHHFVTMAMCWLTAPFIEPISRWYVVMNYFVHSLMYPYFALSVIGVKIPRKLAVTITTFQLCQMLIGLIVNFSSAWIIRMGVPCYRHPFSIKVSLLVYGSFTVLFAKLFFDVLSGNNKSRNLKTSKKSD